MIYDVYEIGQTIFVPTVSSKSISVVCPDCAGAKIWNVSTPTGISTTITCPRCHGEKHEWLTPKRHETILEIAETTISEVSLRRRKKQDGTLANSIDYSTAPYIGHVTHERAYLSREEAQAAGEKMLAEHSTKEDERWRKERERDAERAGHDVLRALTDRANEKVGDLRDKVDRLREKMLDAIKSPNWDGPKLSTRSYGSPELTSQGMADWLGGMLRDCDLEDWTEEELHEAMCHC